MSTIQGTARCISMNFRTQLSAPVDMEGPGNHSNTVVPHLDLYKLSFGGGEGLHGVAFQK